MKKHETSALVQLANALGSELMADNAQYTSRIAIKSLSNPTKSYVLSQRKSSLKWLCGCPDFLFNRKQQSHCKHLRHAMSILEEVENNLAAAAAMNTKNVSVPVEVEADENQDVRTGTAE